MASASQPERRRYTRINFNTRVEFRQGKLAFETELVDVSLNGILIDTPRDYEIRANIPAEARIPLGDEAEIRMTVRLIHSSSEVLGFECESIDVDSIAHLRRLIELNMGDPHAAERVLHELVNPRAPGTESAGKPG